MAACKNASAALFTSAKLSHLALLPQGQVERYRRVVSMVERARQAKVSAAARTKANAKRSARRKSPSHNIARMNREYFKAMLVNRD